jgi:hypothetical protein
MGDVGEPLWSEWPYERQWAEYMGAQERYRTGTGDDPKSFDAYDSRKREEERGIRRYRTMEHRIRNARLGDYVRATTFAGGVVKGTFDPKGTNGVAIREDGEERFTIVDNSDLADFEVLQRP